MPNKNDIDYMREAISEAAKAEAINEVPIGAVIVKGNNIIGRGYNRRETDFNPLAHAELIAIKEASSQLENWRLEDCTLYVTVEPCPMCAGAVQQSRIGRLVYGTTDPKAGAVDTLMNILDNKNLNHRTEVLSGVLEKECKALIQKFFSKLREP